MRFTVTPLGGAGRAVTKIVDAIVRYLTPLTLEPTAPGGPGPGGGEAGPARYYADGAEEPGRWRGRGAQALGLAGEVSEADPATVLAGRDPATGARLVSAQGPAGRRPRFGVGTETRRSSTGIALYDPTDAAAVFGLPAKQIHAMLDVGTTVALSRLFPAADGLPAQPGGSYLVRSSTRPGAGGQHRTAAKRRRRDLGLDHAYAITSYAVQGATRALSTSRIDPTATRAEAYVDITRGQTANHLYLTRPADPLDGEALPSIPPPPIDDAVTRRLARSNGELTAWELHQATHERALQRRVDAIGL